MLPPAAAGYPTSSECEQILRKHNLPEPVILHMQQVNKLAQRIALYLNSCGYRLHLALLQAACLLHDIAKGQKNHAEKGRQLLEALGYRDVAALVATHMNLPAGHTQVDEAMLLFLADKMIEGTEIVSLEEKKSKRKEAFAGNPAAQQAVEVRLQKALFWQQSGKYYWQTHHGARAKANESKKIYLIRHAEPEQISKEKFIWDN